MVTGCQWQSQAVWGRCERQSRTGHGQSNQSRAVATRCANNASTLNLKRGEEGAEKVLRSGGKKRENGGKQGSEGARERASERGSERGSEGAREGAREPGRERASERWRERERAVPSTWNMVK